MCKVTLNARLDDKSNANLIQSFMYPFHFTMGSIVKHEFEVTINSFKYEM